MNKREAKEVISCVLCNANSDSTPYWGRNIQEALDVLFPDESEEKPKRWRAEKGEPFWLINTMGEPQQITDLDIEWDNKVFNIGNYFQTEEEARIYAEKFKYILKGRINNEQN